MRAALALVLFLVAPLAGWGSGEGSPALAVGPAEGGRKLAVQTLDEAGFAALPRSASIVFDSMAVQGVASSTTYRFGHVRARLSLHRVGTPAEGRFSRRHLVVLAEGISFEFPVGTTAVGMRYASDRVFTAILHGADGQSTSFKLDSRSAAFVGWRSEPGIRRLVLAGPDGSGPGTTVYIDELFHGPQPEDIVDLVYRSVLGRSPDPEGRSYWAQELSWLESAGAGRTELRNALATLFFASAEYRERNRPDAQYVEDLFQVFLARRPDEGGLRYWEGLLRGGSSRRVVLALVMFSPESEALAARTLGDNLARSEAGLFVDYYRAFFQRLPDGPGLAYWSVRWEALVCVLMHPFLRSEGRKNLPRAFIGSAEYSRDKPASEYVADLLLGLLRGRSDPESVQRWIAELDSGVLTRDQLLARILESSAYQSHISRTGSSGCPR